jgi:uncharacterized damage-inducible protein DinB
MRRPWSSFLGLLTLAVALPAVAAEPAAPLPAGFRGDYVKLLAGVERELVSLEQAMPQDKFGWRPGKGVRSVGEVYLHAAGSVYFFLGKIGVPPPADLSAVLEGDKYETQTSNKDQIKTILTRDIEFLRKAILNASDADLDGTVEFFGQQLTRRALYMALFGHLREHLGQSIAYARVNGVVPPWSKKDKS